MRSTSTFARCQRGFTVMELVITVVILGILAVVGTSMISDTFTTARVVNAGQSSANEARYAVERIARELREVSFVSDAAGYDITSTLSPSASSVSFNRSINNATVTVTITRTGSNLTLGYSSPATVSTLATQASNFTLDFLALNKLTGAVSATTSKADVRFVVVSLTLNDATSGQAITERTRVALRNMK